MRPKHFDTDLIKAQRGQGFGRWLGSAQHPNPDPPQHCHRHQRQGQHGKALELLRIHGSPSREPNLQDHSHAHGNGGLALKCSGDQFGDLPERPIP